MSLLGGEIRCERSCVERRTYDDDEIKTCELLHPGMHENKYMNYIHVCGVVWCGVSVTVVLVILY